MNKRNVALEVIRVIWAKLGKDDLHSIRAFFGNRISMEARNKAVKLGLRTFEYQKKKVKMDEKDREIPKCHKEPMQPIDRRLVDGEIVITYRCTLCNRTVEKVLKRKNEKEKDKRKMSLSRGEVAEVLHMTRKGVSAPDITRRIMDRRCEGGFAETLLDVEEIMKTTELTEVETLSYIRGLEHDNAGLEARVEKGMQKIRDLRDTNIELKRDLDDLRALWRIRI